MDEAKIEEMRNKLHDREGLSFALVRAALGEVAKGNIAFVKGLSDSIADIPDATAELKTIAAELESLA